LARCERAKCAENISKLCRTVVDNLVLLCPVRESRARVADLKSVRAGTSGGDGI